MAEHSSIISRDFVDIATPPVSPRQVNRPEIRREEEIEMRPHPAEPIQVVEENGPNANIAEADEIVLPDAALRDGSTIGNNDLAERSHHTAEDTNPHGIYLRSPALMVSCWLLGLISSLCHHFFYQHYSNAEIRSENEQQWNIR
jgi:hypothetical protein